MSISQIEDGAVLRRHHQAMSVVEALPDAETRLALLNYVVYGAAAVEEAFRASSRDLRSDRRGAGARHEQVLALRARGYTLRQIADELGYKNESGPSRILRAAG